MVYVECRNEESHINVFLSHILAWPYICDGIERFKYMTEFKVFFDVRSMDFSSNLFENNSFKIIR